MEPQMPNAQPRRRSRDRQPAALNRFSPVAAESQPAPPWSVLTILLNQDSPANVYLITTGWIDNQSMHAIADLVIGGHTVDSIMDFEPGLLQITMDGVIEFEDGWSLPADPTRADNHGAPRLETSGQILKAISNL